jgi:hypothetical protein
LTIDLAGHPMERGNKVTGRGDAVDTGGALAILTVVSLGLTLAFFALVRRRRSRESDDDTPDNEAK